jgi:hypothetical protein
MSKQVAVLSPKQAHIEALRDWRAGQLQNLATTIEERLTAYVIAKTNTILDEVTSS